MTVQTITWATLVANWVLLAVNIHLLRKNKRNLRSTDSLIAELEKMGRQKEQAERNILS